MIHFNLKSFKFMFQNAAGLAAFTCDYCCPTAAVSWGISHPIAIVPIHSRISSTTGIVFTYSCSFSTTAVYIQDRISHTIVFVYDCSCSTTGTTGTTGTLPLFPPFPSTKIFSLQNPFTRHLRDSIPRG